MAFRSSWYWFCSDTIPASQGLLLFVIQRLRGRKKRSGIFAHLHAIVVFPFDIEELDAGKRICHLILCIMRANLMFRGTASLSDYYFCGRS